MLALDASPKATSFPDWVPVEFRNYVSHTAEGHSIRALARAAGCHASTILRQVRKCETRREDALVDLAIARLSERVAPGASGKSAKTPRADHANPNASETLPSTDTVKREAPRILRRLNEPGACLAIAEDMKKAVVVRENATGDTIRTAVAARAIAEALAVKDWIVLDGDGRVKRYRITAAGRVALKEMLAKQEGKRAGLTPPETGGKPALGSSGKQRARARYGAAESPLLTLARRLDKNGQPFLSPDLVAAGERLREDFELSEIKGQPSEILEKLVSENVAAPARKKDLKAGGATAARARVFSALADLGPGLGDVIVRCCCYLEGMEAVERRMGWSARSGKIVFRIALTRLKRHYEEEGGKWSPLIG